MFCISTCGYLHVDLNGESNRIKKLEAGAWENVHFHSGYMSYYISHIQLHHCITYIKYIDSLSQGIFFDLRSRDKWCLLDKGRSTELFFGTVEVKIFRVPRIYSP